MPAGQAVIPAGPGTLRLRPAPPAASPLPPRIAAHATAPGDRPLGCDRLGA